MHALILSIEITVHLFYQIVSDHRKNLQLPRSKKKFEEQVPDAYAEQLTVKKVQLGVGFFII